MPKIEIRDVTFAYEGSQTNVFTNVSFSFDNHWKLGFVGRNGRGKTTMLRILLGELQYTGQILSPVPFTGFPSPIPNRDCTTLSVIQLLSPDSEEWEIRRELSLLQVNESVLLQPFSSLSLGEQTKIQLAALFLRENAFLLIDEPTNHLDTTSRHALAKYLSGKEGFLLVSHDRQFLDACTDHILAINKTGLQITKGNFSTWYQNRMLADAHEADENARLEKEIGHLKQAAGRTARWSDKLEDTKIGQGAPDRGYIGHKSAKMMKRTKNIEKRRAAAIEEKENLLKDIEYNSPLKIRPLTHHAKRLVHAESLKVQYGNRTIFRDLSFTLYTGDRVALSGRNGCGKTSVIKLLNGEIVPHTGLLQRASRLVISYVPQDTSFLTGSLTDYARQCAIDESLFKTILRKLDFRREQFEKDMRDFSAGQRKKVLIARSLCESAHLYLWDEPLNFIDVLSRMQIEELLLTYKPTMVFVEHDAAFVDKVATDVIKFL